MSELSGSATENSLNISLPPEASNSTVKSCCIRTIDGLAHINTMMVCGECKHIIKTFKEERAYRNYVKFCQSRLRNINTGWYKDQWVVTFI